MDAVAQGRRPDTDRDVERAALPGGEGVAALIFRDGFGFQVRWSLHLVGARRHAHIWPPALRQKLQPVCASGDMGRLVTRHRVIGPSGSSSGGKTCVLGQHVVVQENIDWFNANFTSWVMLPGTQVECSGGRWSLEQ